MESLSQNDKIIWNCWEEKSSRDIVREAAAKGTYINLAIKFLTYKNTWSESIAKDWFLAEVKAWTVQLLMRKQIFKVLHILNKCSLNPEEHLISIAETATEIEYRDFIVEHLQKLTKDMKTENIDKWEDFKRHWNLLRCLENSFEVCGTFKQNKVFGIGNDRVFVNESEIKALTVEKITNYSADWKCKIATCLFFDTFEFALLHFSSPFEMWNHLVHNNKSMILVRWINIQMSEVVRDMNSRYNFFNNDNFVQKLLNVDTKGFTNEVLDTLDEIFRKWFISEEMIRAVSNSNCFDYTKMCIYDTLASYGIVLHDKKDDLCQIISRLSRTQNLNLLDEILSESCATMSSQEFYFELVKYFVRNKLYKVLTICVEGHILDTDLSEIDQETRDCIELWLLFKSIEKTSDRQSHVVPVYKTCQQIAKDNIDNYISSNPHLVLGMLLLEDKANLFDIFSKEFLEFKDFKLPNMGYKNKLPHLYNVYMKHISENHMYESKDVNVYQLLSGYRGLDVSKIFEFQIINMNTSHQSLDKTDRRSLGSLLSDKVDVCLKNLSQRPVDMPDFANERLMKKYGYEAKLNHIYYLKQYRPCNASQAFVSQQYQRYNRLQEKGIKSACCEAHALALQNWFDPAMAACAISFVTMIGCNPTRCRVHISATKMIKHHLMARKGISENEVNKIINDYMTKLIQNNDDTANNILQMLEEITLSNLKEVGEAQGKLDMALVLYESQTVVKFAILHNLPLPEMQLIEFVKNNSWFNFLLFGDVFRYPLAQMFRLSQKFDKKSYSEHLKHIVMHKITEDEKEQKPSSGNGQRRLSRLNSLEVAAQSPTQSIAFEFPSTAPYMGRELWEVAAACHGPEDPPAALLRAADANREPLLVLIASCYEPNAVDVLWAHWILSSLEPNARSREALQAEVAQNVPAQLFQKVAEICLKEGYISTLHESMLIFFPESPLALLTAFLYRSIRLLMFDSETNKYLSGFIQHCLRRYSVDATNMPYGLPKESLQKIAISLVKIALTHNFDVAFHQKEFLRCLVDVSFGRDFIVSSPNFTVLHEIFVISMETSKIMDVAKMLQNDASIYFQECVEMYSRDKNYNVALKIAKLAGISVDSILICEWDKKFLHVTFVPDDDGGVEDKDITRFVAQCSEAFREAGVTLNEAVAFLAKLSDRLTDPRQKFYSYRIIMSWFEHSQLYGDKREEIEHAMWEAYFLDASNDVVLYDYRGTIKFVLNDQKVSFGSRKADMLHEEKPFMLTLHEIEVESDVMNIEKVETLDEHKDVELWQKAVNMLLELKLIVEAFRLSALFRTPDEYGHRTPACPVLVVRTCLRLAEGTSSPYELPQELRLLISSPTLQHKLSASETSDTSFEELVVIQERPDGEEIPHLAAREEADRLSALDALAVKSGLTVAKQVANYFRIALQIGWDYASVLKYQSRPLDFINLVSGRARMSLANLVFRTFNVPSKQIAEYLCRELVAAIISPHLVKSSIYKQKEHFQYTLWGYVLDSDLEMFLNMRPDACSHIGRLMLDHLMAFQNIYKATESSKIPENTLDDSCLDVETLVDEEYQNVQGDDLDSVLTEGTLMSEDTQSVYSASTTYAGAGKHVARDSRRNLFDVISKNNVHIRYEVKLNIRKITKGAKLSSKQVNIISLEQLVVAHECCSAACDTEGVAAALRAAAALAARLLAARSWRLLVRLLTGLARYAECAYVLQALRDNHQFEFLLGQFDYMLGQQQDKIAEFKHGLLDFLKTHCPGDTDAYIMVALHFNMHAEAANVKRKQAFDLIDDLEKMATDANKTTKKSSQPVWLMIHDNAATRSLLDTALNHCTDACELYLQGGCTGFAGDMATLAQQIALQISLLNASPTRLILNRSTEQVYSLVSDYLSLLEGAVLAGGGGGGAGGGAGGGGGVGGVAWRELAYRRALSHDQVYLRDLACYRPDLAYDFLDRYKSEKKTTAVSQAAMTELRALLR